MAKRSNKRPTPLEKHNASCMWAFISFFDFRRGPLTPKLLPDKKPGSSRHGGNSNSDNELDRLSSFGDHHEHANNVMETKAEGVDLSSANPKTLTGKETSREHSERNMIYEHSDLGHSTRSGKILQQKSKKHKVTSTASINNKHGPARLDDQQSDKISPTNRPSHNFDLVAFLIKLCTRKRPSQEILVHCDSNIDLCFAMKDIVHKLNGQPDEFDFHLNPKEYVLYKALLDIFKAIADQAFVDNKHVVKSVHSKGFMDALAILDSNKDVVLKLLKDSNSQFNKQIQYLQEIGLGKLTMLASENKPEKVQVFQEADISSRKDERVGSRELVHSQNRHSFFWRKDKSKEKKKSKNSQKKPVALSRIVVLKPTPVRTQEDHIKLIPSFSPGSHNKDNEEETNQIVSYFSLGEIKKRLKHIIGGSKKERQVISMDRILDKIPLGYKVSVEKDQLLNSRDSGMILESKSCRHAENPGVPVPMENDNIVNPRECELNIRNDVCVVKASRICEEAKAHCSEMLDSINKTTPFPTARVSTSLGKLLSLPDFDVLSPRMGDRRDEKVLALPSQENVSFPLPQFNEEDVTNSLSPLKENLEGSSCSADHQNDALILDLKSELIDAHMREELCTLSDLDHGGSVQNVEIVDIARKLVHEQSDVSEPTYNASDVACERCNEVLGPLEVEALTVRQCELSTSSFQKGTREFPVSIIRKTIQFWKGSSPVPILERFISDEFSSSKLRAVHPFLPTTDDAKTTFRTYFGDSKAGIKYVEAVLNASGLRTIDLSERWHLADKLLDPSLFDEVARSFSPQTDDPKLLFDCISETLEEIQEKYFKCTPWVSMLTYNYQKAPVGSLIKEVGKRIERNILINVPNIVDHIILNSLEDGRWMDLQFETEEIVIEIWDTALDDLVDETIFDLWLELSDDW